ncbi:MAG: MBOAT family O-acyltransferase [Planctomycetota bacterium]|jgi:alginate O-acetyltransferase complex protein AlgI
MASQLAELSPSLLDLRFLGLLVAVVVLRPLVPIRWFPAFGALASVALIGIASPATLIAIGAVTLGYLYPLRLLICRAKRGAGGKPAAKRWFAGGIVGLIVLMALFKVYRQFTLPWLGGPAMSEAVVALFGFSYFLFRAIDYLYMHYLLDIQERGPVAVVFYAFFPSTLTSGPIQKYVDFKAQLEKPVPLRLGTLAEGVYRITKGYFRKLCLAFVLFEVAGDLLAGSRPTVYASIAVLFFLYLYFYFDFAGYSDIAIGFGLLLGIRVPENFRKPFTATSVTEFWRHWHISLVDWFREHVFIPLGGMRSSRTRAAFLAFIIMALVGLWHGLTWMFLAWGAWHGAMLLLEAVTGSRPMARTARHGPAFWSRVLWTNARVAIGGVFFLPATDSFGFVLEGFLHWW